MVTIKDIAKEVGVTPATVSYVLNNKGSVSEATRQKILAAAMKMHYIPNRNAQFLKEKSSKTVGLFVSFFSGSFFMYLTESMSHALKLVGYDLEVHITSKSGMELASQMASANIDAAILLHYNCSQADAETIISLMAEKEIPLIFLDRELCGKGCSSIVIDNANGMQQMVEYLFETGHRKIAYLRGEDGYDGSKRYEGYRHAMNLLRLPIRDEWQFYAGDLSEWSGFQAIKAAFSNLNEIPDAICCENDCLALGCIEALKVYGFSVPQDLSVTGFDNLVPAQLADISLTTIQNPISKMARMAVDEAIRLMSKPQGRVIFAEIQFIKKDSCAIRR